MGVYVKWDVWAVNHRGRMRRKNQHHYRGCLHGLGIDDRSALEISWALDYRLYNTFFFHSLSLEAFAVQSVSQNSSLHSAPKIENLSKNQTCCLVISLCYRFRVCPRCRDVVTMLILIYLTLSRRPGV